MLGQARQQECEAVGHSASEISKHRVKNTSAQITISFAFSISSHKMVLPTFKMALPTTIHKLPPRNTQRYVSKVILDTVRCQSVLTMNHHGEGDHSRALPLSSLWSTMASLAI